MRFLGQIISSLQFLYNKTVIKVKILKYFGPKIALANLSIFLAGGKPVDADQEMVALGICNFMSSFVSAMPITGSFSRTAVNSASGVKTTFGCLWTGALVMLTLGLIMPYCAYIPKASLAAVIITAVIFSVEYEVIRPMWRSKSKLFSQTSD